jgi:hypothetical protein
MAQSDESMWAFEHYLKGNPFKRPLTNEDITAMADLFYSYNTVAVGTARPAVDADFGDCDWPDFTAVADAGGITATRDTASIDGARYPESHRGS